MKSIYYKTTSSEVVNTIKEFCKAEGFKSFDLFKKNLDLSDIPMGILIIDPEFINEVTNCALPLVFTKRPSNYNLPHYEMNKDVDAVHLRLLVDTALNGGIIQNITGSYRMVSFSSFYEITNDIFSIDKTIYNITRELVFFFDLSSLQKIRVAISEIITNAIEHGNLEITGEEKFEATEKDTYYDLLEERLKIPRILKKKVKVSLSVNKKMLKVVVEDKGKGFDTSTIKKEYGNDSLFKLHGRGILIASMYFDDISYNKKGNKATLIKRIKCSKC
jgi:anti-sigma regulatory factor (Ser/Thr protein kinase)